MHRVFGANTSGFVAPTVKYQIYVMCHASPERGAEVGAQNYHPSSNYQPRICKGV